jgi:hypothetical protein
MRDAIAGAVVGGLLGIAGTVGFGFYKYYTIDLPTLQQTQTNAANEEAARKRAEEREAKQREQLTALQRQSDEVKRQFGIAKQQFISHVTDAVNDGVTPIPGAEPRRPVPADVADRTYVSRARKIVDERDRARTNIKSLTSNLNRIHDELDSDIDELKSVIDNQPPDQRKLRMLLQKIADKWPTKQRLLEEIAQNSLQQIGCPVQLASNP